MNSTMMMKWFLIQYVFCAVLCIKEQNFPRALYWAGASVLTVSILWGMK